MRIENVAGPVNTLHWAIEGVHADKATVPWRRCWELLSRAVERYRGEDKWTSAELLTAVTSGRCQLWIAWSYDRRRVEGAVITRLVDSPPMAPGERVCEGVLVGGDNLAEWGPQMMGLLKAWALDQGCSYIGGPGRKGWMRAFGFVEVGETQEGMPVLAMPLKASA
jgi:hypothetical protein